MNDVFVEQLIECRQDTKGSLSKLGIVIAAIAVSTLFLVVGALRFIFPFVLAACCWGAYQLIRNLNFEYEYSFTNGELDVDKIIGRRKRERLLSIKVRSISLMAPMTEMYRSEYESDSIGSSIDASSSPKSENRWFAKYTDTAGVLTLLIFEPNDRLIAAMRTFNSRNIKDA